MIIDKQRYPIKYLRLRKKNEESTVEEFDRKIYKNEIDSYLK